MRILHVLGLLALGILACSASCDKNEIPSGPASHLQGSWQYIGYSGGFAGFPFRADRAKAGFLQLQDSSYIQDVNGEKSCGYFRIIGAQDAAVVKGPYLIFSDQSSGPAVRFKGDTLLLIQPYADGMTTYYVPSDTSLRPCPEMVP